MSQVATLGSTRRTHPSKGRSGLRPDVARLERFLQEEMRRILDQDGCPTAQELVARCVLEFPEALNLGLESLADHLVSLRTLVRKEQALRQFLLSVRSLCSVWSVRDAERAFLASSFMKKSFDVAEWKSLLLGPSLSKHPAWSEVFREFEMPQHKWMQYDVPPDELSDAVTAMELLFEHRVESSGMDGAIDFTKEIKFEEFERWLLARGMILEDCGVCINKHKFGLIMGSMNGALAHEHRLQKEAEERYLDKLLQHAEEEVHKETARLAEVDDEAAAFRLRWHRVARTRSRSQLAGDLCLWAKHKLGCDVHPLRPMAAALAMELRAEATEEETEAACVSPMELEETVRRQLAATEPGLAGLLKLERGVLGAASMEQLLPGEGSFLNFLVQKQELRVLVEEVLAPQHPNQAQARAKEGGDAEGLGAAAESSELRDSRDLDAALRELKPGCAVVDVELAAKAQQRLRRQGLEASVLELLGTAPERSAFGSGWATRIKDVKAFHLLQTHVNLVLRTAGPAALNYHFGERSALALGACPQDDKTLVPQLSHLLNSGLHVEAHALSQLLAARRSVDLPAERKNDTEAEAAAKAAQTLLEGQKPTVSQSMFHRLHEPPLAGHVTAEKALDALAGLAFLEDAESSLCWQELFAPSLGSLPEFLCQQAEEGQLLKRDLKFLVLAPTALGCAGLLPRVARLPPASAEAFAAAVAAGAARRAAAQLAALCVEEPGEVQALVYYFKLGLKDLKSRLSATTSSSEQPSAAVCSALAVSLLKALPAGLRAMLGALVVLPCLKEELGWAEACCTAALRLGCRPMLAALALHWDVPLWGLEPLPPPAADSEDFFRALGVDSRRSADANEAQGADGAVTRNLGAESGEAAGALPATPGTGETQEVEPLVCPTALGDDEKCEFLQSIRAGFCLDQQDAAQLQRNLGGALKRLGDDLYREQHHFVFELLQNGDDNEYAEGVVPCYQLILCEDMLVALSNEVGFSQANVDSLCSVDSSTKPRLDDGEERIGKKGIGFKSVFKITDTPTIHSNGWHFRFNAKLKLENVNIKELGYIVPEAMPAGDMMFPSWRTEIRLPFKPGLGNEERNILQQDFRALDGTLLLNLNKLKRLILECSSDAMDSGSGDYRSLKSEDLCDPQPVSSAEGEVKWNLVRISDGLVRDWLCVEGAFPFRATERGRLVRMKVSFPLPQGGADKWLQEELPTQQTFCYLPLRSFGWKFVLHANFDVTASRNELHSSSPWNLRIKELLPKLLAVSGRILQEHLMPCSQPENEPEAREHAAFYAHVPYSYFLRFMPLPGELGGSGLNSDFFAGSEGHIWQRLRRERCVLSDEGVWMEPHRVFQAPDNMKQVISSGQLQQFHDGLCYLHSQFVGLSHETMHHLGVRTLEAAFDVLLTVLGRMAAEKKLGASFVRRALALAYSLIWASWQEALPNDPGDRLRKLGALQILPVQGDAEVLHGASAVGLFLPETSGCFPESLMSALEIQILLPELFEGEEGRLARRILEHAGVRSLTPSAIIWDGVIPLLAKTRCPKTVALCLAFLASRPFSDFEDGRKKTSVESALQTALKVPVRHGSGEVTLSGLPEPMLLGEEFHNILAQEAIDAEVSHAHEVLAGASSRSDHPCVEAPLLLTAAAEIGIQASQVARFLVQHCSVTMGHFPVLTRTLQVPVQEIAHHSPHLAETVAELVQEEGDASAIQLRDAESPSLTAMLSRQLDVQLLVASYVLELQRHMTATLTLKSSKKCPPSALATELMRRPWVPSSSALAKPGDTRFLWDTPELPGLTGKLKPRVLAVLQPHVPIVRDENLSGGFRKLLQQLGSKQLASRDVLQLLRTWSESRTEITEGEMTVVYESLHTLHIHNRTTDVEEAFQANAERLIFVPLDAKLTKRNNSDSNRMHGKWVAASSCCILEDRQFTNRVGGHLSQLQAVRELELHYAKVLEAPFVRFGIEKFPTEEHRIHSIAAAASSKEFNNAIRIAETLLAQTFEWAGPGQERRRGEPLDPEHCRTLRRCFSRHRSLPTQNHGWVAWHDGCDEQPGAVEVCLPSQQAHGKKVLHARLQRLFGVFLELGMKRAEEAEAEDAAAATADSVPKAAETPSCEVTNEGNDSEAGDVLRQAMAYVQCWLHIVHPQVYHILNTRAPALHSLVMREAEALQIAGRKVSAFMSAESATLFLDSTKRGRDMQQALQLLLGHPRGLRLQRSDEVGANAEMLGTEVLIRLAESERPGRAAFNVLCEFGYECPDPPASLPLAWWFGKPPLLVEEAPPTVATGALAPGTGRGRWTRHLGVEDAKDRIAGSGSTPSTGPGHVAGPAGPAGSAGPAPGPDSEVDCWSARRSAEVVRRSSDLAGSSFGSVSGDQGAGQATRAQAWAALQAQELDNVIQHLGLGRGSAGLSCSRASSQLRKADSHAREERQDLEALSQHAAQLRALAAAGVLGEERGGPVAPWAAQRPGEVLQGLEEQLSQHWTFQHLPNLDEMQGLPEDAPGELGVPTVGRLTADDERKVATWGEQWVFKTLRRKYAHDPDVLVRWLNQSDEQFEFYDISVVHPDGRQDFYEVKSTITRDKRLLEVSEKQVIEASLLKSRFNLVRVFGAGSSSARMLLVPNPSAQCLRKAQSGVELLLKLP
ncbi:unnamed protein product [Effrenium voratum]|uniref:Protein NO VEIN C-terminal domain-containing protein n=1 Tax=Effrenium voratum TaxID=2562239 RepID=A0AA36MIV1_9DINO|nr:unnamed protein product [Effrenium voratum]